MITYGVGKIVAARLAKSYPREHIINNIRYSLSQQHRVRNMGAYIARAIKEDYYSSRGTDDSIKSVKQLEEGMLAGESVLAKDAKEAKYVSKEALQSGDILKALDNASDTATKVDDIPINKHVVRELKQQLKQYQNNKM